jgi:hypothetical protein
MPAQTSKYAQSVCIDLTEAEAVKLDKICQAAELTREAFVKLVIADSLRGHDTTVGLKSSNTACDIVSLLKTNSQKLETVSRVLELLSEYIPDAEFASQTLPAEVSL